VHKFPFPDWKGATVVILGGGPSLNNEQIAYVEPQHAAGKIKVAGLNRAYLIAKWLDWLHGGDAWFWQHHTGNRKGDWKGERPTKLPCLKSCCEAPREPLRLGQDIYQLPFAKRGRGLPFVDPKKPIHYGFDSGYQLIQAVIVAGATKLVLLGFDGRPGNWHEGYGGRTTSLWDKVHDSHGHLAGVVKEKGVEVWNCSPGSSFRCWPMEKLEEILT